MGKILILSNSFNGLYNFRKMLIQELLNKGNEVYLVSPQGDYEECFEEMGCQCYRLHMERRGMNPLKDWKLFRSYYKLVKNIEPDLVITYTIKPNIYGGMVCRLKKVPYASNITGLGTAFQKEGTLKKMVTFLYRNALKKAKVVFFENSGNKQTMIENNVVKDSQTVVLNGAGVDLEKFPYSNYSEEETKEFLFIGRVMREKGVDELFEALEKLNQKYSEVKLNIVGGLEDNYKDKIEELSNNNLVIYYGYQNDVKPFIEKSCCLVLPSYHEGMANVLLEAAATGRPLITSKIHGCMEAVEEGRNGYLVEAQNAGELYAQMLKFVELPYEKKAEMGKNSRDLMEEKFDKRKVVEKTIGELLNEKAN